MKRGADQAKTEYGIRLPSGEILWADDTRGRTRHTPARLAVDAEAADEWLKDLGGIADRVGLNQAWFAKNNVLMKRETTVTVSEPIEVLLPTRTVKDRN